MDGWMDGWVGGWMDVCMNGWMNVSLLAYMCCMHVGKYPCTYACLHVCMHDPGYVSCMRGGMEAWMQG